MPEKPVLPFTSGASSTTRGAEGLRPTGLPQLDALLHGGLPANATVLIAGASGTGKTILATEWLFAGYDQFKEPGLFVSLSEPVAKVMKSADRLSFFKEEYLNPSQVLFTDPREMLKDLDFANKEFDRDDIKAFIESLGALARQSSAKRIVIDSVTAMAYRLKDRDLIRDFIFELGILFASLEANIILTGETSEEGNSIFGVEEFISDGIIKLYYERATNREPLRKLDVVKMRGSSYEPFPTSYRITESGIRFFPHLQRGPDYPVSSDRVSTGVPGLDQMTYGGYFVGSSVLLTGASGTGKSIISMQFMVDGLKKSEKAMYVSFEESHDQLVRNALAFGWNLEEYERNGLLKIVVSYPDQYYLEEHVDVLRRAVEEFAPQRIIIDSLSALEIRFSQDVLYDIASRLMAYFKEQKVTTLLTIATDSLMGTANITDAGLSTMTDHIIMLRYIEIQSELRHGLFILKMRGSPHDKKMRELEFGRQGVRVMSDFSGYEGVLSGATRKVGKSTQEQLRALFLETFGPMGEQLFTEETAKGLTPEGLKKLSAQLAAQSVISTRKDEEFAYQVDLIFGVVAAPATVSAKSSEVVVPAEITLDSFLHPGRSGPGLK